MEYTIQEINRIGYLFPEMPRAEPMPHIDTIVVEFLRLHGVEATPVSSNVNPSRATNALMGAISPYALAENTHMTQRQKTAALQEWTSWKQWALSHRDWPDFHAAIRQRQEAASADQESWLAANKARIEARLEQRQKQADAEMGSLVRFVGMFMGAILFFALIAGVVEALHLQTLPAVPEKTAQ